MRPDSTRHGRSTTVEHVKPRAHGGGEGLENKSAACRRSNILRDLAPEEAFRRIVDAFGPDLPEIDTPRYSALRAGLRAMCERRPARIRVPYRRMISDEISSAD